MATSEPAITLVGRRLIAENVRFRVYFDEIVDHRGNRVRDYLAVVPRERGEQGSSGITVLPIRDGRLGLVRVCRHPGGGTGWEAPMGFMDRGETPEAAALRELEEETGLRASRADLVDLGGMWPAPSVIDGHIRLFAARVSGIEAAHPEDEAGHGEFAWFSREDAARLAREDQIVEPTTLVALYRYLVER